jgi:hypothetical protein
VFGAGAVPSFPAGEYIFEIWKNGARAFSTNAELPTMTAQNQIDLGDKLDYTLTTGLSPLVRNVRSTTGGGYNATLHATYDTAAVTPPAMVDQNVVKQLASPKVSLPIGRYTIAQNTVLYVYADDVLWVGMNGTMYRMYPYVTGYDNHSAHMFATRGSPNATFDTTSNVFSASYPYTTSKKLDASMRDI